MRDGSAVIVEAQSENSGGFRSVHIVSAYVEHASPLAPLISSRAMRQRKRLKQAKETTEKWGKAIHLHNDHDTTTFNAHTTDDRSSMVHYKTSSPLIYKPQCRETVIVMRIAETLAYEGAGDSWYDEIPARYGHANCSDSAAEALLLVSEYGRGLCDVTRVLKVISKALTTLRLTIRYMVCALMMD